MAQYALSGIDKPIGVAEYQLLRDLPDTSVSNLPSIAEIEAEFGGGRVLMENNGNEIGIECPFLLVLNLADANVITVYPAAICNPIADRP